MASIVAILKKGKIMNKCYKFYIFIILVFALSPKAFAEPIKIVTLNWEPYIGNTISNNGVHAAVIEEAFKRTVHNVSFEFMPWKRAYHEALNTNVFLASASKNEERVKIFFYSEPYDDAATYLVGNKKKDYSKYNGSINGLLSYNIGVLLGHYAEKYLNDNGIHVEPLPSDTKNFQKLFLDRIDLVAISKLPALQILKKIDRVDDAVFLEPPLKKIQFI